MEDHEIRAELQANRESLRSLAAEMRRSIFNDRKALEDPHLTPDQRDALERLIFDQMESLRETEDAIQSSSETIASLGSAQDAHGENIAGMIVGAVVFIVLLAVILS